MQLATTLSSTKTREPSEKAEAHKKVLKQKLILVSV